MTSPAVASLLQEGSLWVVKRGATLPLYDETLRFVRDAREGEACLVVAIER